jgi:hypothetical protein
MGGKWNACREDTADERSNWGMVALIKKSGPFDEN